MAGKENGGKDRGNTDFAPYLQTLNVFPSIAKGIVANDKLFPIDNPGLRQALIAELVQRVYRAQGQLSPELSPEELARVTRIDVGIILLSISKKLLKQFQNPDNSRFIVDKLMSIYEKRIKAAKKRKALRSSTTDSGDTAA